MSWLLIPFNGDIDDAVRHRAQRANANPPAPDSTASALRNLQCTCQRTKTKTGTKTGTKEGGKGTDTKTGPKTGGKTGDKGTSAKTGGNLTGTKRGKKT